MGAATCPTTTAWSPASASSWPTSSVKPLDKVTVEAHLIDDLDADSLDIVDLTIAVEEEFSTDDVQLEIPEDDAAEIRSVQDLVAYLTNAGIT